MKKIAHVQVIPKLSGAQKFSLEIFKNVSNFEKYIICAEFEDETEEQRNDFVAHFKQANVNIIWCKNLKRKIGFHDIKSIIELYNIFRKYKFDVVHTNSTKPGIIARIAAKIAGVKKVIHTVHGISFHKEVNIFSRIIFYFLEIVALQFGNTNVTVNKNYLKYYKFMFWKKSLCIYNGLDFKTLSTNKNRIHNKENNDTKNILFVGRLDQQKDPLGLIKIFHECSLTNNNLILNIVGDGELRTECEELSNKLNLNEKINFLGWISEPSLFYNNADLFVCPSKFEAFGFTFAEAAFFEIPIVATNVEGIPEVVINNKMGYLYPPYNYSDMAQGVLKILDNEELKKSMSEFGLQYVTDNFQLDKCITQYLNLYNK